MLPEYVPICKTYINYVIFCRILAYLFVTQTIFSGSTLQRKWKNLRDNFAKELRKQKNLPSGSGAQQLNTYIYFTRLRFLERSVSNKETSSNFGNDRSEVPQENEDFTGPGSSRQTNPMPNSNKKIKLNAVDQHFSDILTRSLLSREQREQQQNNQDEDKLFCLSLYKELKKVPERGRLKTKIELLEVIQRAQDLYSPVQTQLRMHHPYTHPYSYPNREYNSGYMSVPSTAVPHQPLPQFTPPLPPPIPPVNRLSSPPIDVTAPTPSPANSYSSELMDLFE